MSADSGVASEPRTGRLRLVAAVAAIVLVLDQATKIWAVAALDDRVIDLFWTLRFRLHFNTGSAFSIGAGFGRWLAILVLAITIGVILYARQIADRRGRMLLGLIVGGAIGNLVDRVFRADDGLLSGAVVDFIDFQWWPVFNIADMGVVCGAIGLMVFSLWMPAAEDPTPAETLVDQDRFEVEEVDDAEDAPSS